MQQPREVCVCVCIHTQIQTEPSSGSAKQLRVSNCKPKTQGARWVPCRAAAAGLREVEGLKGQDTRLSLVCSRPTEGAD